MVYVNDRIARDDVRLCNCAKCGKELLGPSNPDKAFLPSEFQQHQTAFMVDNRGICGQCLTVAGWMDAMKPGV